MGLDLEWEILIVRFFGKGWKYDRLAINIWILSELR